MKSTAIIGALALLGVADCTSADSSSSTCASTYPRGVLPVAPEDVLADVIANCNADSGSCSASLPCVGSAGSRICDPAKFVTAGAATCVAQGEGLEPGLDLETISVKRGLAI